MRARGGGGYHMAIMIIKNLCHFFLFFLYFFLIVYSLLNIHRDLPVLFCIHVCL